MLASYDIDFAEPSTAEGITLLTPEKNNDTHSF